MTRKQNDICLLIQLPRFIVYSLLLLFYKVTLYYNGLLCCVSLLYVGSLICYAIKAYKSEMLLIVRVLL